MTHELRPEVVAWQIVQTHVDDFVCGDERGEVRARLLFAQPRMAQYGQSHGQSRSVTRSVTMGLE